MTFPHSIHHESIHNNLGNYLCAIQYNKFQDDYLHTLYNIKSHTSKNITHNLEIRIEEQLLLCINEQVDLYSKIKRSLDILNDNISNHTGIYEKIYGILINSYYQSGNYEIAVYYFIQLINKSNIINCINYVPKYYYKMLKQCILDPRYREFIPKIIEDICILYENNILILDNICILILRQKNIIDIKPLIQTLKKINYTKLLKYI